MHRSLALACVSAFFATVALVAPLSDALASSVPSAPVARQSVSADGPCPSGQYPWQTDYVKTYNDGHKVEIHDTSGCLIQPRRLTEPQRIQQQAIFTRMLLTVEAPAGVKFVETKYYGPLLGADGKPVNEAPTQLWGGSFVDRIFGGDTLGF